MNKETNLREKAAVLRGIDIFSGLAEADLRALSTKMKRRSREPGKVMFREGESGSELFVLVSGLVLISVRGEDGEEIELSRLGPGAFFGEMAILEKAPRSATCTALEPTTCLVLEAADFEALLAEQPSAAVGVLDRMLGIAASRLMKTGSFLSQMVQWGDAARKRAVTDAWTGLFNRRYLEDSFDSFVSRAKLSGTGLSYAMFDLDRFGKLNATYGAEFCDQVIKVIADEFRAVFEEEDILVRYGGDEFSFILPRSPEEAEKRCEAVCQALRSHVFEEHPELRISCSIGLAHFPGGASSTEELKERADKALYLAKEAGRDRALSWSPEAVAAAATPPPAEPPAPAPSPGEHKAEIPTIAGKNRAQAAILRTLEERDSFLIVGHKDPDEDCVSSMVAFALLASKFGKKASIVLGPAMQGTYTYLLKICRYNSIDIIQEGPLPAFSVLVFVDTPKPDMIDRKELYAAMRADPSIPKLELDHHLGADSVYIGDPGYRLVYEASSTCEIIGRLAMKIESDARLVAKYEISELMSRNLVLAIISGMIGDSQMGKFLKSRRERWFYERFSELFERILAQKTLSGSGNFSSKEQVFEALAALSESEDACFRFMSKNAAQIGAVRFAVLDAEASRVLFATYGKDTVVTVSKALVDSLAEASGCLGLVGFYDDPALSPFVQFRLRRSQRFTGLDLREAIARLEIANGGGHPGAVGFRIERELLPDIVASARRFAEALAEMAGEGAVQGAASSESATM
jgi:diguanylate cyclase (GGDEF)-like protein